MPPTPIPARAKVFSTASLLSQLETWRAQGDQIVFTNGCFDILHEGHVHYLEEASKLGQRLVIGVNDDASVTRLKGEHRPLTPLPSRMIILAALGCVDAVVSFSADTPLSLIEGLKPDVLVKGGDYAIETIVGAQETLSRGGQVIVIPFLDGFSTSALEKKILDQLQSSST